MRSHDCPDCGTDLDQTGDSGHWECRECGWRGIIDE